jgi:hypothetical protein
LDQKLGPDARLLLNFVLVLLEHLDELRADALALLLRVGDALELSEESSRIVDFGNRKVEMIFEHLHDAVALLVP